MLTPLWRQVMVGFCAIIAVPFAYAAGNPVARQMMQQNGCFACHSTGHRLVGPAFGWVAYVFAHKSGAQAILAHKIIGGGTGRWDRWTGGVPMPSHPELTLAQAEQMADWILAQQPIAPPKP